MRKWRLLLSGLLFATGGLLTMAQTSVTGAVELGAGTSNILDTYLSQEKFQGTGATLLFSSERRKPDNPWITVFQHEINAAEGHDRSEQNTELQGDYTFLAGRRYSWQLPTLEISAGALAALNIGGIYNLSNTNNPGQGRLSLQLMPTVAAAYPFTFLGRSWTLRYELQLPLVGLMFSPNYGQSYYEIFVLGNYDHNVVPATLLTVPNIRQHLAIDCSITHRLSLRVAYLGDYQQAEVNHLKSHIYHHRLMVGVVRRFTVM